MSKGNFSHGLIFAKHHTSLFYAGKFLIIWATGQTYYELYSHVKISRDFKVFNSFAALKSNLLPIIQIFSYHFKNRNFTHMLKIYDIKHVHDVV